MNFVYHDSMNVSPRQLSHTSSAQISAPHTHRSATSPDDICYCDKYTRRALAAGSMVASPAVHSGMPQVPVPQTQPTRDRRNAIDITPRVALDYWHIRAEHRIINMMPCTPRGAFVSISFYPAGQLHNGVALTEARYGDGIMDAHTSAHSWMPEHFRNIHSIMLHVNWPGHLPWGRPVILRTSQHSRTLGNLAQDIATIYKQYFDHFSNGTTTNGPQKGSLMIGTRPVQFGDLRLNCIYTPANGDGSHWQAEVSYAVV